MPRDPPLSLLDVPDEILLLVTFFLDPLDVIHFAKVSSCRIYELFEFCPAYGLGSAIVLSVAEYYGVGQDDVLD